MPFESGSVAMTAGDSGTTRHKLIEHLDDMFDAGALAGETQLGVEDGHRNRAEPVGDPCDREEDRCGNNRMSRPAP